MSITFYPESAPAVDWDADEPDQSLHINMCNRNAALVLDALGVEFDYCGALGAEDFLGRVLIAQAVAPADEGMPSYEHARVPGTARMIEGARSAGYLQDRLAELHVVATWAVAHNTEVVWA